MSKAALELFQFGQQEAKERGLLLVDTKYEFGRDTEGNFYLIDEVHTPDSSRYWVRTHLDPGHAPRTWILATNHALGSWPPITHLDPGYQSRTWILATNHTLGSWPRTGKDQREPFSVAGLRNEPSNRPISDVIGTRPKHLFYQFIRGDGPHHIPLCESARVPLP